MMRAYLRKICAQFDVNVEMFVNEAILSGWLKLDSERNQGQNMNHFSLVRAPMPI
jgi:hypothetical protein